MHSQRPLQRLPGEDLQGWLWGAGARCVFQPHHTSAAQDGQVWLDHTALSCPEPSLPTAAFFPLKKDLFLLSERQGSSARSPQHYHLLLQREGNLLLPHCSFQALKCEIRNIALKKKQVWGEEGKWSGKKSDLYTRKRAMLTHPHPMHPHPHTQPSGCKTLSEHTRHYAMRGELCISCSVLNFQYICAWELRVSMHSSD